jgi:hypothetical protein
VPQDEAEGLPARRLPGELNDPQQSRLRITCHYIDKLLSDIEHILRFRVMSSTSPRPRSVWSRTTSGGSADSF